ncbi:flippase [Bifidobacterium aquikefiri]|uniref:flippase n=1 Tax=Bifidobacterium aquikefiri TaxID=1653207 RepID=UPI0013037797|nr:flippase [Bifidobacterium aquikefiri]
MNEEKPLEHKPKIRSVKFNVLMNMILTSSSFIFPLVTVPYASRVLGTRGTGAVAFAQSLIGYFSLFAVMGITVYGVRECARVRDDYKQLSKTVQELLVILLCTTTIVYLVFILAIFFVPKMREETSLMLIFSSGIWLSSFGIDWFYQAIEQYGYITVRNIAFKIVSLIAMFLLVRNASDYVMYGLVTVIAGYGSNVVNMLRLRKLISFKKEGKWDLRRHFKPILSFAISSVSSGIYSQIDIVMLGFLSTTSVVGIYQLAFKIKGVLNAAIGSVGSVMLPRLSFFSGKSNAEKFNRLMVKYINFVMLISLPFISICLLSGNDIVTVLGGNEFRGSAIPLYFLSPVLFLVPINILLSQDLTATNKEKTFAVVTFSTLILSIIICYFFIPIWGGVGAAISIVLTQLFALILNIYFLRKTIFPLFREAQLQKLALAVLLSTAITYAANCSLAILNPLLSVILSCGIFAIIYLGILILLREAVTVSILGKVLVKFGLKKID